MADILSNGTGGGNWEDNSTWAGGVVPSGGDTAIIVSGDTVSIAYDVPCDITVNSGGILFTWATSYTITNNGTMTWTGGDSSGATYNNYGTFHWPAGSLCAGTVYNEGTINYTADIDGRPGWACSGTVTNKGTMSITHLENIYGTIDNFGEINAIGGSLNGTITFEPGSTTTAFHIASNITLTNLDMTGATVTADGYVVTIDELNCTYDGTTTFVTTNEGSFSFIHGLDFIFTGAIDGDMDKTGNWDSQAISSVGIGDGTYKKASPTLYNQIGGVWILTWTGFSWALTDYMSGWFYGSTDPNDPSGAYGRFGEGTVSKISRLPRYGDTAGVTSQTITAGTCPPLLHAANTIITGGTFTAGIYFDGIMDSTTVEGATFTGATMTASNMSVEIDESSCIYDKTTTFTTVSGGSFSFTNGLAFLYTGAVNDPPEEHGNLENLGNWTVGGNPATRLPRYGDTAINTGCFWHVGYGVCLAGTFTNNASDIWGGTFQTLNNSNGGGIHDDNITIANVLNNYGTGTVSGGTFTTLNNYADGTVNGGTITTLNNNAGTVNNGIITTLNNMDGNVTGGSITTLNNVEGYTGSIQGGTITTLNNWTGDVSGGTITTLNLNSGWLYGGTIETMNLFDGMAVGGTVTVSINVYTTTTIGGDGNYTFTISGTTATAYSGEVTVGDYCVYVDTVFVEDGGTWILGPVPPTPATDPLERIYAVSFERLPMESPGKPAESLRRIPMGLSNVDD